MFRGRGTTSSVIQVAGSPSPGGERAAERAGRAGLHERTDAGRDSLLQDDERSGHIGVHELLPRVGSHVRLVQRRGVQDGVRAGHRLPHGRPLGHRRDDVSVRGAQDVQTHHVVAGRAQRPDQGLAEVPGAAGDEDPHGRQGR
jgi:hypothetical protein